MKLLQEEKFEGEVGWLCPESTSIAKINSNVEELKTYIFNAISASDQSGHKYILAPIFQDDHWVLLVICVSVATIYLFDSINKPTDSLRVRQLVNFAFHRYKRCGGKINRQKPLWKFVKCAQQVGGLECGFYIMRYMLEVLKSCSSEKDLEQIYSSRREEPFTDQEINEIRDKWAIYFTNNFLVE